MAITAIAIQTAFSNEVKAFAAKLGVAGFLQPTLEMTCRVFPDAKCINAVLQEDPELPDERQIVFEVDADLGEVSHIADQHWQWSRDLFQLCPASQVCLFGLHVNAVNA